MFQIFRTKHFKQRCEERGICADEAELVHWFVTPDKSGRYVFGPEDADILASVLDKIQLREAFTAPRVKKSKAKSLCDYK